MSETWRIVMEQETGERCQVGRGTFKSFEAACDWIYQEDMEQQHPECRFFVEPNILHPWAV